MAATTYFKELILNDALGNLPYSINWHLGIWTANPGTGGSLTDEIAAVDYVRKQVFWTKVSASEWENTNVITWDEATTDWGIGAYAVLTNSPTKAKGNVLAYQATSSLDINPGVKLRVLAGSLKVTI